MTNWRVYWRVWDQMRVISLHDQQARTNILTYLMLIKGWRHSDLVMTNCNMRCLALNDTGTFNVLVFLDHVTQMTLVCDHAAAHGWHPSDYNNNDSNTAKLPQPTSSANLRTKNTASNVYLLYNCHLYSQRRFDKFLANADDNNKVY